MNLSEQNTVIHEKLLKDGHTYLYERDGRHIYRRKNGSLKVVFFNNEEDMCDTSHSDDCDANVLMARFKHPDLIPKKAVGSYLDTTELPPDFKSAMEVSAHAKSTYENLPEELKDRFKTPQKLVDFMSDPKNTEEALKLGLLDFKPDEVDKNLATLQEIAKNTAKPKKKQTADNDDSNDA